MWIKIRNELHNMAVYAEIKYLRGIWIVNNAIKS